MSTLTETEDTIRTAAEAVGPAVVGLGRGWSLGSGVVVGAGRVLTNAHNLRGEEVTVTFVDGRRAVGRVAGVDPDVDLAAIEVDTGDAPAIAWDPEAEGPSVGTVVIALANPGGRGLRVTPGFVSSANRRFRGPRGRRIAGAIEHTAPLPRGSSGGPLVDRDGRLLGLNAIRQEGGLILAIPADAGLARRADALWRGEPAQRARLGVAIAPPRVARRLRRAVGLSERDGLLVRGVDDDGPAGNAGVQAGDLIVAVDRRPIDSVDVLYDALDAAPAELALTLVRGEDEREVKVALSPEEAAR
jgi:serine protease Do